ncbi:hypothetical protein JCM10914_1795 [Paenibacillus sp. JCM 10914]|nr:hypothetical protein JCM10914_1795 [Paenibacillus sp. JCM 10914]
MEVHHRVESEYEILAEYAHGDGASHVDFQEYVMEDEEAIFENVVNRESEDPMTVVQSQIDLSLDLLVVAKWMQDEKWQLELKRRLAVMSQRRLRLQRQP